MKNSEFNALKLELKQLEERMDKLNKSLNTGKDQGDSVVANQLMFMNGYRMNLLIRVGIEKERRKALYGGK
ncbi:hypothetical protein [Weissella tructae]